MINWTDKESVIAYAERLGSDCVVYKHPERANFNITHKDRLDRYKSEWVVYPFTP